MRLGIFGGSFDPVHLGHLALARACQAQANLDEVWFTPTAIQPLKRRGPNATDSQRVEMLNLAMEAVESEPACPRPRPSWRVCTLEIDRGGYSYTVDTLGQIHTELPEAELFFLVGADTLRDVARWKEPQEIFRLATPLVVCRHGEPSPDLAALRMLCAAEKQPQQIDMQAVDISSSEIRRRVAAREPVDQLLPVAVGAYIAANAIYARDNRREAHAQSADLSS